MAARPLLAEDFVALAIETLETECGPALSPEARSRLMAVIAALRIAERAIRASESEQPHWALLDEVYDDGDGTLDDLARDIRSGKVSVRSRPSLAKDLRRMVEAEIAIDGAAKSRA